MKSTVFCPLPAARRPLIFACALLVSFTAGAAEVDPKLDKAVRAALPVCDGAKVTFEELQVPLPARFKGTLVKVDGGDAHSHCNQQLAGVLSPTGGVYVGMPWPIAAAEGATAELKLQNFVYANFRMTATVDIDRTKPTSDGLFKVTLFEQTESGKLPLEGEVDPEGKVFFFGRFRRADADVRSERVKLFDGLLSKSPSRGPADAKVTIVEFSDFECPSCKRAAGYVDPILTKHDGKIRYVRFDMPLSAHPWAFPAALAGRAIHRQKPETFWEYKKQVYANQDKLNAFVFWDWARAFAEDHELDLKQYDADLMNETLRAELLKGAGLALSNEVRATPTYMVNGVIVDAGHEGKALAEYVEGLLK